MGIYIFYESIYSNDDCLYEFFFEFRRCVFDHGSFNRWTINTKYYTADVAVWMAHLHDGFSVENLPAFQRMTALVMVFDMNDVSFVTFIFL
jgi:hypothetical protein